MPTEAASDLTDSPDSMISKRGSSAPMQRILTPHVMDVQWVDSDGQPTKRGTISGTIATIIETDGEPTMVVFSTGERISLEPLGS